MSTTEKPVIRFKHTAESVMKNLEENPDWLFMALFELANGNHLKDGADTEMTKEGVNLWITEVVSLYAVYKNKLPAGTSKTDIAIKVMDRIDEVMGAKNLIKFIFLDLCEANIEVLVKIANGEVMPSPETVTKPKQEV